MITPPKSWGEWLTTNPVAKELDDHTSLIMGAAQQANNSEKVVELLHENNSLVMMTKPAMGNHLQFSFQHANHGSSLLSQNKSLITITGFDRGTPIEIDTKNLHRAINKTDNPSFTSILNTPDPAQLSNIPPSTDNKIRFKSFVLLTPFLVGGLIPLDDPTAENAYRALISRTPQREEDVFNEMKDNYKVTKSLADDADPSLYQPLRDDIRAESEQGYGDVVYFLYKLLTKEEALHATKCLPITSSLKLQWFHTKQRELQSTIPLPPPPIAPPPGMPAFPTAPTNSLDKIANVFEQEIKRRTKKDDEKNRKGWSKLTEVQKDTILLASMKQDVVKPQHPNDFMLKILECDTGIPARELIYAKLDRNIIQIERGFGTNLARGKLVSQPLERGMNGYSITFIPPDFTLRADSNADDSFVEEQAAHGKISDATLKMLTAYTAKYPKDYNELRHFVKNFRDLIDLLFGHTSIFALAVKDVYNHVSENERCYTQGFLDRRHFGASIVDKIHLRC